jgi:hypothetical protein
MVDMVHDRDFVSHSAASENDGLTLKLSSSTNALEESRTVLNEESANNASVSCLSVKGVFNFFLEGIDNLIIGYLYVKLR